MNTTTQLKEQAAQPVTLPVDLRDYFAATATDSDVAQMRQFVPVVDRTVNRYGVMELRHGQEPHNWRAIARYMHADHMLKARQQ